MSRSLSLSPQISRDSLTRSSPPRFAEATSSTLPQRLITSALPTRHNTSPLFPNAFLPAVPSRLSTVACLAPSRRLFLRRPERVDPTSKPPKLELLSPRRQTSTLPLTNPRPPQPSPPSLSDSCLLALPPLPPLNLPNMATHPITPQLAEALSARIQPKLVEIGWSVGSDDSSPLSEYICLMLANGKGQEQIAAELSGDLLGLEPGDESASQFAAWLWGVMEELTGGGGSSAGGENGANDGEQQGQGGGMQMSEDHEMGDGGAVEGEGAVYVSSPLRCRGSVEADDTRPTGPRAMRSGSNAQPPAGGRRMLSQLTRAMERRPEDRPDAALHRVNRLGGDRIGKDKYGSPGHRGGLMGGNHRPGPMNNGRFNNHRGGPMGGRMNGARGGNNMAAAAAAAAGAFPMPMPPGMEMSQEQQMAMFQMLQQQAQMMGLPFLGPNGQPVPMPNNGGRGGFNNRGGMNGRGGFQHHAPGASLFDRIQSPPDLNSTTPEPDRDSSMADSSSDVGTKSKPEEVPCKFGTGCTKTECIFGHPTPAAPRDRGVVLYVSGERCPFGIGCKNRKCTGSHPSPAAAGGPTGGKKIDAECRFWPNCTNPNCQFKQ